MAWTVNWLHITMAGLGTTLTYSFSVILKTGPKAKFVLKKTLFTLFVQMQMLACVYVHHESYNP